MRTSAEPRIAIACGGTGGHLFPGLSIAHQLVRRGASITLLISPKEVDQQAVKNISGMEIVTLPAVGLSSGKKIAFLRGFFQSYRAAQKHFRNSPPHAALAMGGFTSAPPILAAKQAGAQTFLHESNTIPGRANRWLSRVVPQAFIGFPQAASRLHSRKVTVTGTPVRPEFQLRDAAACRTVLSLDPRRPVLLVIGGSQGATGINNLVIHSLPLLPPELQFIHFTGANDLERVRCAYAKKNLPAVVHSFSNQMDLALGAATLTISRAGASSLAEIAAMRVPAILVPFPAATDNHQYFNARAFEESGAAHLLSVKGAPADATQDVIIKTLTGWVARLVQNETEREKIKIALAQWHAPKAAEEIAEHILRTITDKYPSPTRLEPARETKRDAANVRVIYETTPA